MMTVIHDDYVDDDQDDGVGKCDESDEDLEGESE